MKKLAADLRRLRLAEGGPTYESLARATGLSRSTVADAFGGNRLPSERTLFALVKELGEPTDGWLSRRAVLVQMRDDEDTLEVDSVAEDTLDSLPSREQVRATAAETVAMAASAPRLSSTTDSADPQIPTAPADTQVLGTLDERRPSAPHSFEPPRIGVTLLVPMLLAAFALGLVAGHLWWPRDASSDVLEGGSVAPATGEDNLAAGCSADARPIASASGSYDTQLQLMFSTACNAVWAQLYRYDADLDGNELRVQIYPSRDGVDPGPAQEASATDAQYALTTIIVRNAATDQFCAEGWVTNDGVEVSVGDPVCV